MTTNMIRETMNTLPTTHKSTYFPANSDSLSNQNIIYTSHVPLIPSGQSTLSSFPSIEDLACNMINVKATCKGSLQVATIPPEADIYIYEESQGGYILRNIKTGTMSYPSTIPDIECTSSTRSNKFKLTFPEYVDIEGYLDIIDGTVYQLYIIMEKCAATEPGIESSLIPALAFGGLMFVLFGEDNKKYKTFKDYDKYREIYE